uniref:SUEL-type lectin domain-containing protein n=1 Tax=Sinocyclocheilus grahami TaxID=75366 RepID=A0A672SYX8_SINGR
MLFKGVIIVHLSLFYLKDCGVHFTKLLLHPLCSVGSSVICEHANNTLMCDQGTVIRIHSANYCRTDSSTCCTGRPASQLAKTDCYASNSQAMATYVCSLVTSNGVFSAPCTNTFKYLYVSYSCIHNFIYW